MVQHPISFLILNVLYKGFQVRYHLFQKFFGKVVKIKQMSFLFKLSVLSQPNTTVPECLSKKMIILRCTINANTIMIARKIENDSFSQNLNAVSSCPWWKTIDFSKTSITVTDLFPTTLKVRAREIWESKKSFIWLIWLKQY